MATAAQAFTPPFCPNSTCDFHSISEGWRFRKAGFYERIANPRKIQRYRCTHCRRYFSDQTFSVTYWLKRPELLAPVFEATLSGTGHRQLARFRDCSPSTVMHQVARLGRHCLLAHQYLRPKDPPRSSTVIDGFESFEFSQFFPMHINIAVDSEAHFIYAFTDAPLRRKGRTTARQKNKRAQLEAQFGRPDPKAIEKSVAELVRLVAPEGGAVTIHSDDHPAYKRAFRRVEALEITHRTTSSKAARTAGNPLFPVNRVDLWARHNGANHKRETIAFSKRRQGALYRAAIFAVWRNYVKSVSERRRDAPPGVAVGAIRRAMTVSEVLQLRRFPWRSELTGWLERCYYGRIPTRRLARRRTHQLTYAV